MTSVDDAPAAVSPASNRWARAARPAEIVLGVVFLASALLKMVDINLFLFQIAQFGMPWLGLQSFYALSILLVETFLGVMLLWGPRRRRLVLGLTALLLIAFTGAIVYGAVRYGIDDCGCMGGLVKMPPAVSVVKNLILLGLVAVAAVGFHQAGRLKAAPLPWKRRFWSLYRPALALVAAFAVVAGAIWLIDPVQRKVLGERPFARFVVPAEAGESLDLGRGEYFVAFLGTRCPHCLRAVEGLNYFDGHDDFPPVVGLTSGTAENLEAFKERSHPQFPIQIIEPAEFYQFIGVGFPRYYLVRDGEIVDYWDGRLPTGVILRAALAPPNE